MLSLYINNNEGSYKKVNQQGNEVNVQLQPPILLDKNKKYQLRVLSANIVYCQPNITSANNKFIYKYNNVWYTKTLPTGIYGLTQINDTIARINTAQHGHQLFAFVANEATSTIIIYFSDPNTYIDCTTLGTIMPILGYGNSTSDIGGYTTSFGYVQSTEQAHLNTLQEILIKCNITNGSFIF